MQDNWFSLWADLARLTRDFRTRLLAAAFLCALAPGLPLPTWAQTDCIPRPLGLVAWWTGEGNALDRAGTNHGTLQNGATFAPGKVGQAFSFDGVDDFVDAGTDTQFNFGGGTGDFTIIAWIWPVAMPSFAAGIVGKATQNPYTGWTFYFYGDGRLGFGGAGVWEVTGPAGLITVGAWHHVAVVKLGSVYRLYHDGAEIVSRDYGALQTSTVSLCLGSIHQEAYRVNGLLDELAVFDRALSANEIASLHNAGGAGICRLQVATHTPAYGAHNVPTNTAVTATFSQAINPATVTANSFLLKNRANQFIAGAVSYDPATFTATFAPVQPLEAGTAYEATLTSAVRGPDEETLANWSWWFSTGPDSGGTNCTPQPEGLISWWPGEGNADDVMGHHPGTAQNGVSYVPGYVGKAFRFDGVDDHVDLGTWFDLETFTVALWVKSAASQGFSDIMDNNHSGVHNWTIQSVSGGGGNTYGWLVIDGSPYSGVGFTLAADTWQHLVLRRDTNRLNQVYLDGVLVGSAMGAGPIGYNGAQRLWLGRCVEGGGSRPWYGLQDEIMVFNRALSSNEIAVIYSAGLCGPMRVAVVSPTNGAMNVPTNAIITATFTKLMNPFSLTTNSFLVRDRAGALVPGTVAYDDASLTVTFTPTLPLDASNVYRALLTADARDASGESLRNGRAWTFSTASNLVLISTDTTLGASDTNYNGRDVLILNCTVTLASGTHAFRSLLVDGSASLVLQGATIRNCTITTGNGARLVGTEVGGTLDGVTVNGELDLTGWDGANVTVVNGLALNGTARVGNATNGSCAHVHFVGSQALSGNGVVIFGNRGETQLNVLRVASWGATLTLGPGITVRGQRGTVGNYGGWPFWGPSDGTVVNQGTIAADVAGGLIVVSGQSVTNQGSVVARNGATLDLQGVAGNLGQVGTISNATLNVSGNFTNEQALTVVGGATLNLGGTWNNAGVISVTNATVSLGGTWSNGGTIHIQNALLNLQGAALNMGAMAVSGSTINVLSGYTTAQVRGVENGVMAVQIGPGGVLDNSGATLVLNGAADSWRLTGGTLRGGTITTGNGARLVGTEAGGTLDGVTVNGELDLTGWDGANVTVVNGLALNGTARVGNATNGSCAHVHFVGSQALSGNGVVIFGNRGETQLNVLRVASWGATLTLGPGITVRGQRGTMGNYGGWPFWGPSDGTVVNQGTIAADVAGGLIVVSGQSAVTEGRLQAGPGTLLVQPQYASSDGNADLLADGTLDFNGSLIFNGAYRLTAQPNTTVLLSGSLLGHTRNNGQFNAQGALVLDGSGSAGSPQLLEVMSRDMGLQPAGFIHNFAYASLSLAHNTFVQLVDQSDNATGSGPEALYVNSLVVPTGCTLDLNGLRVYTRGAQLGGSVLHGTVSQIPDSGVLATGTPTAGTISAPGEMDEWSFFARAGQWVTVVANPGNGGGALGFVEARLLATNGPALATNSSATPAEVVLLRDVVLPADGTYRVQVRAAAAYSANTGAYQVAVWDVTPRGGSLTLNQIVNGYVETPYSVDRWEFSAVAGLQVRLDLVSVYGPGVAFDLQGPDGWIGFSNLLADSDLVTLPTSGRYAIIAHGMGGQYDGTYSFRLVPTEQQPLTLGVGYQGELVGSGQAQLFQFDLPTTAPLWIVLASSVTNNHCELYARFGAPPTRASFDARGHDAAGGGQQILMSCATVGSWYVLVFGDDIHTPGTFTLRASSANILLLSVTPNRGGRNLENTLTLGGAGFDASCSVALLAGDGTAYPATRRDVDSFTQVTATFAPGTLPVGAYSVRVAQTGGAVSTLSNTFTVLEVGEARLATAPIVPATMGYHAVATAYAEYRNDGEVAMPAPLLVLTAEQNGRAGAFLSLSPNRLVEGFWTSADPEGFSHSVQILASGQTPGVLQPGESVRVPVYYAGWQQPWDMEYPGVEWKLGVLKSDDTTPVDWAALKDSMKPASISVEAWDALWPAFTAQVGTTWGDYARMLADNAAYLGRLGQRVVDVGQLLAFALMQADGLSPLRSLAGSVDAAVEAPGLPLVFTRSFPSSLLQRFDLGPLGRGWSHNWQYALQQDADGTVTIAGPGGSRRVFKPDGRAAGTYFAQAGDHGTLAPAAGGGFTLREQTGLLYRFRADGLLDGVEDPIGNRITCAYGGNRLTRLDHSSGQRLQLAWNGAGRIQTITDHLGRQTVLGYDGGNEHLVRAQYADGRTATYEYQSLLTPAATHALTAVANSCCTRRSFDYDAQGRLAGTSLDGNAEAATFTRDPAGRVTVTDALGHSSSFFFDHRGLLVKATDALGRAVAMDFDDNYNLVRLTDPAGRSHKYRYDLVGNLDQITDPLGHNTYFHHWSPPTAPTKAAPKLSVSPIPPTYTRLMSVSDANRNETAYHYFSDGTLQDITYPDGSRESWTYDDVGNAFSWRNRRGGETIYSYDEAGRVTAKYFEDGSMATYFYDDHGNLTEAATYDPFLAPLEASLMTYDAHDRLTRLEYPGGKFLAFAYDSAGRRASSLDQLGHQLTYHYSAAGRLESMTNELGQAVVRYEYDPAGRLARKTLANGLFTTYQYDSAGQLLNLTNSLADGTLLSRYNYAYDSRGRRTAMDTLDGRWNYDYDDLGQLTHAVFASTAPDLPNQDLTYMYDALGNRIRTIENGVTTDYTANNLNQYVIVGDTHCVFDADGNLVQEIAPGRTTTYAYTDESRLVGVTTPQGTWEYVYDALGNRVATTENGLTKRYVIDPIGLGNVVGEYGSSGDLLARYDHGFGLLARSDAAGSPAYYTFDAIGNVQQSVTAEGMVANAYAYKPFGTETGKPETIPNPFQYVGEFGVVTEGDGLIFMRARFHQPKWGRFIAPEPLIVAAANRNDFSYVRNNPISQIDPLGLFEGPPGLWDFYQEMANRACERIRAPALQLVELGYRHDLVDGGARMPRQASEVRQCPFVAPLAGETWNPLWRPPIPPNPPTQPGGIGTTGITRPTDPNQKIGPAGSGPAGFISATRALAYRVDFENETNASAPAQQVVITDPLSTNFDLGTFQWTELGFGDLLIVLPPNTRHFETNVPMTSLDTPFEVQIELGLRGSGEAYAIFRSIDPATSLPPPVNIGFLPPEDGTRRGQGHVAYLVGARPNLPTGTPIRNVALIAFDRQPAIATNQRELHDAAAGNDPAKECLLTIDAVAPTSSVRPLPAQSQGLQIPVAWTGQDDAGGSGIASYDVFVSDNSGPWTLWQSATADTNGSYRGLPLHTYGFRSTAHDHAGNLEAAHLTADATTTVVVVPFLELTVAPARTNLNPGDTFTYTLTVKNSGTLNLAGVVLSNPLPAGLFVEWVQYGRGSCDLGEDWLVWSLGSVNTNKSYTLTVTASVIGSETMTNFLVVGDNAGAASASAQQIIRVGGSSPQLSIALTNRQIVVSWPDAAAGFNLQSTTNLASQSSWAAVTNVAVVVGEQRNVSLPPANTSQFYRLKKP